jgi:WD40 repeat protein
MSHRLSRVVWGVGLLVALGVAMAQQPPVRVEKNAVDEDDWPKYEFKKHERSTLGKVGDKSVGAVAFSPDGRLLASAHYTAGVFRLWDLSLDKSQAKPLLEAKVSHAGNVAFSPDGKSLAVLGRVDKGMRHDTVLQLWDVPKKAARADLTFPGGAGCMAYSPDGKLVAVGGPYTEKSVILVDPEAGKELARLSDHSADVTAVAFSPDGTVLAAGCQTGGVHLWDCKTRKEVSRFLAHPVERYIRGLAFSADGKEVIACAGGQPIRVYSVVTTNEVAAFEAPLSSVDCLTPSPDGKVLAAGGVTDEVVLFHMPRGKLWGYLSGHIGTVKTVAISPDGKVIASGGGDEIVRLWNMPKKD